MTGLEEPERCESMAGFSRERFCVVLDASKLTQKQIASLSGVSQGTISQYRTGHTREPKVSHIFRIADAIGCSCEEFRKPVNASIQWRITPEYPEEESGD